MLQIGFSCLLLLLFTMAFLACIPFLFLFFLYGSFESKAKRSMLALPPWAKPLQLYDLVAVKKLELPFTICDTLKIRWVLSNECNNHSCVLVQLVVLISIVSSLSTFKIKTKCGVVNSPINYHVRLVYDALWIWCEMPTCQLWSLKESLIHFGYLQTRMEFSLTEILAHSSSRYNAPSS